MKRNCNNCINRCVTKRSYKGGIEPSQVEVPFIPITEDWFAQGINTCVFDYPQDAVMSGVAECTGWTKLEEETKMKRSNLITLIQQYNVKAMVAQAMTCDEMIAEITKLGGAEYLIGTLERCPECSTLPCSVVAEARNKYGKKEVKSSKREEVMAKGISKEDAWAQARAEARKLDGEVVVEESPASREIISSEELRNVASVSVPVGNSVNAYRINNPSEMDKLISDNALNKYMVFEKEWVKQEDGSSKKVEVLKTLGDYNYPPIFPVNSPMFHAILSGELKVCCITQRDQNNKIKKGYKDKIFNLFSEAAEEAGYLCICPDFKRTELRIYYGTPEQIAKFFGITEEKVFASLDKLHKWVKLVDSPTKIEVRDERIVKFLYHEEDVNEYGKVVKDGSGWYNGDVHVVNEKTDKTAWFGFAQFMQIRSYRAAGMLAKCNLITNKKKFRYEATRMKSIYGINPNQYEVILNQHAIKFDGIGLKPGQIYEVRLCDLVRIINMRLRAGSSTLGAQLVAASCMPAMRSILEEHGLLDAAHNIKELAKGVPEAWIELSKGFEKVDTNKFLDLSLCINRKWGWRMPKLYNIHNRNMSFLESEWRKSISSRKVNVRSAYTYTDDRCDKAMKDWFAKTGEWKSFVTIDHDMEWNDKMEIITIKYPLHSAPCLCSHTILTEDIFNPESPVIYGIEGGVGFSTLYERSVHGLDDDGDKVAVFKSSVTIPVKIDLSIAPKEEKGEKPVIKSLHDACVFMREMAEIAAAETQGIGFKDLAVRYALTYLHLNNIEVTPEMASLIGAMREGNIKGGTKGKDGLKGIEVDADIDTLVSIKAGTLTEDTVNWMSSISKTKIEMISPMGEFNPNNLAEVVHALVIKGAKCNSNKHSDKFLFRMLTLLPAYMKHTGNKDNVPWHNAFEILAEGIKPEYLEFDKNDHNVISAQYRATMKLIEDSFKSFGHEELGYSFDLDMVKGFGDWLMGFYKDNRDAILNDYRGIRDRITNEVLRVGDWDAERRARRFQRLNRTIRFILYGIRPHNVDIESLPHGSIPSGILTRSAWFAEESKDSLAYLKFMNIYVSAKSINSLGKTGNSGELSRLFPAKPFIAAREMYYDVVPQGKKEERNPYIDLSRDLAIKFDAEWLVRTQKWLERNPYAEEFFYPEVDADNHEEDEISAQHDED